MRAVTVVDEKKYKKIMRFMIGLISVLFTVAVIMTVRLAVILKKENENAEPDGEISYATVYSPSSVAQSSNEGTLSVLSSEKNTQSNAPAPATEGTEKTTAKSPDAALSKAEILSNLSKAINKTKQLKGNISVHHTESFTANITECTGGSLGKAVANKLMGSVVKPVDETLEFKNGTATNSDGEQIMLLLPKNGPFSIDESGVKKAVTYKKDGLTVTEVVLVSESVGINDVPKANAAAVGYLDVKNFDLMGLQVTEAEIIYKGTVLRVFVDDEGYVRRAEYSIPLHVSGKGAKGTLSGYAIFDGEQREVWEF